MHEMSVATLARQLGVTQRRANQLVAGGQISARRTDSGAWLVDAASADAYTRRRRTTRGLTADAAWALLFMLSNERAEWTSESTRARLRRRIRAHSAELIAQEVAGRTRVYRYRASNLALAEDGLLLTGRSAIEALNTDLLPDRGRLSGYVPAGTSVDEWATTRFMVADPAGAVFLFANTIPADGSDARLPGAVVAADLAISADAREREAGLEAIEEMRSRWLSSTE
ncbi:hypothetical protein [uncultured Schumannella sp.]|uniref:hypothetical protein n=1 Tax=uncultured Schumannella sp. TaxID=1195956 RepID=UPI0025D9E7E6|nr:hypothetical protein [uncultured Schumannella sp.]